VNVWEGDGAVNEHCLDGFFGGLLGIKAEILEIDIAINLPGEGEVAVRPEANLSPSMRKGQITVDDSTRGPYRELARAGLLMTGHNFRDARQSFYALTETGWDFVNTPSPGIFAALRA
jgi:hypothetical protein